MQEFLREHASFRRTILREIERTGPVLGRDLHDPKPRTEKHRWWGTRRAPEALGHLYVRVPSGFKTAEGFADDAGATTTTCPLPGLIPTTADATPVRLRVVPELK